MRKSSIQNQNVDDTANQMGALVSGAAGNPEVASLSQCTVPKQGHEQASASLGNAAQSSEPSLENTVAGGNAVSHVPNAHSASNGMQPQMGPNGRPLSSNGGFSWTNMPLGNADSDRTSLHSVARSHQQNCGSMPNLNDTTTQSVDLLADIMGASNQNKPGQNTNCNNGNSAAVFGAIMSEQLSSSMPCGLNTIDCNGAYTGDGTAPDVSYNNGHMNGPPNGTVHRQTSVPTSLPIGESGRPTSLPNVNDPSRKCN